MDEYRKHLAKDAALERRFQQIMVKEPTVEETKKILAGLRERYEAHHHVRITNEAWRPRPIWPTATSVTVSCPTRPSTWWTRPPRASASRTCVRPPT
jgi:hypothetical protein